MGLEDSLKTAFPKAEIKTTNGPPSFESATGEENSSLNNTDTTTAATTTPAAVVIENNQTPVVKTEGGADTTTGTTTTTAATTTTPTAATTTTPAAETTTAPVVKTFEQEFKEKFGIDYSDDVINKVKNPPAYEFKSETAKKLEEYKAQGGNEDDFLATQTIDFKELNELELLAYDMQMKNPTMSEREIEFELNSKYGIKNWKDNVEDYEGGVEPEEIELQKLRFEREGKESLARLLAYQEKWKVPQNTPVTVDKQKEQETALELKKEYERLTSDVVDKLEKLSIPIELEKDGKVKQAFEYVIDASDGTKAEVKKLISDMYTKNFYEQFIGSDGKLDLNKMAVKMYQFNNLEKIARTIHNDAIAKGREQVINGEYKNTNFTPNAQSNNNSTTKTGSQTAIEKGLGAGFLNK